MKGNTEAKGFTLLELLIVIAIIVTLGVILIFVLNPAETLAKSRDAQRISDLSTMKTALSVYSTTVTGSNFDLDGTGNHACFDSGGANATISYSNESALQDCTAAGAPADGADADGTFAADFCVNVAANSTLTDGSGWVPVDFGDIVGGSPISSLPVDPVNDIASGTSTATAPTNEGLVYRYACQANTTAAGAPENVFEFNAVLESQAYTTDDDRMGADGGDNANYYEVGTSVLLMGAGTDF